MAPQARRSGMTVGRSRSGVRVAGSSVAEVALQALGMGVERACR